MYRATLSAATSPGGDIFLPSYHDNDHPAWAILQRSDEPKQSIRILKEVLPIRKIKALDHANPWWHKDGVLPHFPLPIATWIGSPFILETHQHEHHILLLLHRGVFTICQDGHSIQLSSGEGVLLSGSGFRLYSQSSSCTALIIDPLKLLQEATTIAHPGWLPPCKALPLHKPCLFAVDANGNTPVFLAAFQQLIQSILHLAPQRQGMVQALAPTRILLRLLASLVFPDLHRSAPCNASPLVGKVERNNVIDDPLDDVLRFIQANLDQPLTLSQLAGMAKFSSRALQYAFHSRCGCAPMQWVRKQRLLRAQQLLLEVGYSGSLSSIAEACGYRSTGCFVCAYKKAFGVTPTAFLRQREFSS